MVPHELELDLGRYLRDETIEASKPTPLEKFQKFARRRRGTVTAAAIIALTLVGGAGISTWQAVRAKHAERAKDDLLWNASRDGHSVGMRAIAEGRQEEGLAYLRRALEYQPGNTAALAASAVNSFGFNALPFPTRWARSFPARKELLDGVVADICSNGEWIAINCEKETVEIIELASGTTVARIRCRARISSAVFAPDNRTLAVGGGSREHGGFVKLVGVPSGEEVEELTFEQPVFSLHFADEGQTLAITTTDALRFFDLAKKEVKGQIVTGTPCHIDPSVKSLAMAGKNGLAVIDISGGLPAPGNDDNEPAPNSWQWQGESTQWPQFSPDGQLVALRQDLKSDYASGMSEYRVVVLNSRNGDEVLLSKTLNADYGRKPRMEFSPDGRRIAVGTGKKGSSGKFDNEVAIFEIATGEEEGQFPLINGEVKSIAFSPDGRWIALADWRTGKIFEVSSGRLIKEINLDDGIKSVRFDESGKWLVSVSGEGMAVNECLLKDMPVSRDLSEHGISEAGSSQDAEDLALAGVSPDGKILAVGTWGEFVYLLESGNGFTREKINFAEATALDFSPNGQLLVLGNTDGKVVVVQLSSSETINEFKFRDEIATAKFSPDGTLLSVADAGGAVKIFDISSGTAVYNSAVGGTDLEGPAQTSSLTYSHDSSLLAAVEFGHRIQVISTIDGKKQFEIEADGHIYGAQFTRDRRLLICSSADQEMGSGLLTIFDQSTGSRLTSYKIEGEPTSIDSTFDGKWVGITAAEEWVRLLNLMDGTSVIRSTPGDWIRSVCFDQSGYWLVAEGDAAAVFLEASSGIQVARAPWTDETTWMRGSADGRWLGRAGEDDVICVTDLNWLCNPSQTANQAWIASLRLQSMQTPDVSGRMSPASIPQLESDQKLLASWISHTPPSSEKWVHDILSWKASRPAQRTLSPWNETKVWEVGGRCLMEAEVYSGAIDEVTQSAPWHPLSPVSLARMEAEELYLSDAPRIKFLASLTMQRLESADESLYGRDKIAEYAAWSAGIMFRELSLPDEARKAVRFAMDRTEGSYLEALKELEKEILDGL